MSNREFFQIRPWMCIAVIGALFTILNAFPVRYVLLKVFGRGADRTAMNLVLGTALFYVFAHLGGKLWARR